MGVLTAAEQDLVKSLPAEKGYSDYGATLVARIRTSRLSTSIQAPLLFSTVYMTTLKHFRRNRLDFGGGAIVKDDTFGNIEIQGISNCWRVVIVACAGSMGLWVVLEYRPPLMSGRL